MSNVVSLSKGDRVSLSKPNGLPLSKIAMGLGWDPAKSKGFLGFGGTAKEIDLDASCLVLDDDKQLLDTIWFRNKISACGSIRHGGDNLTGAGDGDDETIDVDLDRLNPRAKYLVFTVNSFRNQTFNEVENAHCSIYDMEAGRKTKLTFMNISEKGNNTGMVMAALERVAGGWKVIALAKATPGNVVTDMIAAVKSAL
ncbi:TerD family protein [Pseudomonas serbica]|jgi:tellurium resistance protein TerZ|uniref:TerD family protein n=1 Tax=Pseudomonas serbica TaxID=2965074 RepID=UPI00237B4F1F|nr:TerD family protein [Pseudomonas serbica]